MPNLFVISDTHFHHANILNFKDSFGSPVRSFSSVQEMDEYMVDKWNSVVRPHDKVYHLGDVTMGKDLSILSKLNGHKRLVRGNHDDCKISDYLVHFDEVYATRVIDRLLFSHIPVHPDSIGKHLANVHGHIHQQPSPQGRYVNVSVEAINYTPMALEDLKIMVKRITKAK